MLCPKGFTLSNVTLSMVYVFPKLDTDSTCISDCRQLITQVSVCIHRFMLGVL